MTRSRETAAQLDHTIDSLLGGRPGPSAEDEGELTATARLLRVSLPRLHPRFGFEELLAARLAAARRLELAPDDGEPTPIRSRIAPDAPARFAGPPEAEPDEVADRRRRNLVAGGAIASGVSLALPIAGAAIVVWRRSRSSGGML